MSFTRSMRLSSFERCRCVRRGRPSCRSDRGGPACPSRGGLAVEARDTLGLHPARRTVVVFGGSQGALRLDRAVAGAIRRPELRERGDLQLLVLAGPAHLDVFSDPDVEPTALIVRVLPF